MVKLKVFCLTLILESHVVFSRKSFGSFEEGVGYLQSETCTSLDPRIPGAVFRALFVPETSSVLIPL